jgi:RES domain-containing protein
MAAAAPGRADRAAGPGLPPRPQLEAIDGIPHSEQAAAALLWRICIPAEVWAPPHGGGRWSGPGEPMVYAALSPALAALEALAHRDGSDLRQPHRLGSIALPDGPRLWLRQSELEPGWLDREAQTRAFGSAWLRSMRSVLLFVPSALVPDACNVLVNAAHPDWQPQRLRGRVREFRFDPRLI